MKIFIRQIKIIVSIFSFFFIIFLVLSNPSAPLQYNLKRIQEKVILKLRITPQSNLKYQLKLLDKRLNEIIFIIDMNEHSYILKSSLRYSTTAGQITEYILKNNIEIDNTSILYIFNNHREIFQNIIDNYPKGLDMEWKYIQDDINYLDIYSKMLIKD